MLRYRENARITIYRQGTPIATPLITEACRVKRVLMGDHTLTLAWQDTEAHEFHRGDYVDDEIFGRFTLTDDALPKYDGGVYKYELTFQAWYMLWRNDIAMLTLRDARGKLTRKECSWRLTDNITRHVEQAMANLEALGYKGGKPDIDDRPNGTIEEPTAARFISYDAKNVIEALGLIADAWQTEWWVTGTPAEWVLHFGKCQHGEQQVLDSRDFTALTTQRASDKAVDRLYAFGSKDNIPYSYRKALCFSVTGTKIGTLGYPIDKKFEPYMFQRNEKDAFTGEDTYTVELYGGTPDNPTKRHVPTGRYTFTFNADESSIDDVWRISTGDGAVGNAYIMVRRTIRIEGSSSRQVFTDCQLISFKPNTRYALYPELPMRDDDYIPPANPETEVELDFPSASATFNVNAGDYYMSVYFAVDGNTIYDSDGKQTMLDYEVSSGNAPLDTRYSEDCTLIPVGTEGQTAGAVGVKATDANGRTVNVNINTNKYRPYEAARYYVGITDEQGHEMSSIPLGTTFTIDAAYVTYRVPFSFFSTDYDDPSALLSVAERRLCLPAPGYVGTDDNTNGEREEVVAFDDIYPCGKVRIKAVYEENATEIVEITGQQDKDEQRWQWKKYHVQLENLQGTPFLFDKEYILDGYKLQLRFLPPEGSTQAHHQLAGMDFEVEYNDTHRPDKTCLNADGANEATTSIEHCYTLVRNDTYGAKLPTPLMRPHVGDTCCLVGWDVKAMTDMGIIVDAEQRLQTRAEQYFTARKDGGQTLDLTLAPAYLFRLAGAYIPYDTEQGAYLVDGYVLRPYIVDGEQRFRVEPGEPINGKGDYIVHAEPAPNAPYLVLNDYDAYALPELGMAVRVVDGSLRGGAYASRVIGYEYKLDKPFDHPRLTIGDTDAYSRLKRLEKHVQKLG